MVFCCVLIDCYYSVIVMRVAMIASFWPQISPSGSAIYAYELSKYLSQRKIEVHFIAASGTFKSMRFSLNPLFHVCLKRTYFMLKNVYPVVNVVDELIKLDVDIIHAHSYVYPATLQATLVKKLKKKGAFIVHIHGSLRSIPKTFLVKMKELIYDPLMGSFILKSADKVVSIAKNDIPTIYQKFKCKALWLPNAVNTDRFKPPPNKDNRFSMRTVAYIGRLEHWKGIGDLIKIIKIVYEKVPDAKFLIIGSGSMRSLLERVKVPITIKDNVPYERIHEVYHNISILVLPSYMEGAPNVLLEAGASGVPVVASRVGDVPFIVKNNETGYVIEPGNIKEFAKRIIELLTNEDLWKSMSLKSVKYITSKFSFDAIVKKVLEVYFSAINA